MARKRYFSWIKSPLILLLGSCLVSCELGPNYQQPAPPATNKYTALPLPRKTNTQTFVMGRDIPGEWWALFRSPQLNQLMDEGIRNNPNLIAAKAALTEARDLLRAQIGESYLPSIGLDLNGKKTKSTGINFGVPVSDIFSLYSAQVNASYILDVFGGQRRLVETFRAKVDYARYELLAAYLTLTSNVALAYIDLASLQAQIITTLELIRDQTKILSIVKKQYEVGGAAESDVIAQETLLAQTKATLPPLRKAFSTSQHELAILIGKLPSNFIPKKTNLYVLNLPKRLPITVPSVLVKQRPDIQASSALLHEASANIGVATANLLPQITLSADYGWIGNMVSELFKNQTSIWSYGADLIQTISEGGALVAKRKAAIAAFHQSLAQYHETVLNAFKEIADTLRAIIDDSQTYRQEYAAEKDAKQTLKITQHQLRVGGTNFLNVLDAEEKYLRIKLDRIKAQAARYTDSVTLFQALGGGWWNNIAAVSDIDLPSPKSTMLPMPRTIHTRSKQS